MSDEQYIRRAIELAMNGRGQVEPNPMVGCVIVKGNRIIGEGIHRQYGGPHAEPNALAHCSESPAGATAYVTLEPCCHTNKQTPPCVPRLIEAKIARVVIGCLDPNTEVNGRGVHQLEEAGILVDGPVLELQCRQLIAAFTARTQYKRPYFTMKWAETADGKIAGAGGARLQISNPISSRQVHQLRSRCDAILVGINTVLVDNPVLLPRGIPFKPSYLRIVLDRNLRLPLNSKLVQTIDQSPVLICGDAVKNPARAEALTNAGVSVVSSWNEVFSTGSLSNVLIEAGPTIARSLFQITDRLWVIRSPTNLSDNSAPSAADIPSDFVQTGDVNLNGDIICEYLNARSDVYFSPAQSADLMLAKKVG